MDRRKFLAGSIPFHFEKSRVIAITKQPQPQLQDCKEKKRQQQGKETKDPFTTSRKAWPSRHRATPEALRATRWSDWVGLFL
jgi:hypothetical protein